MLQGAEAYAERKAYNSNRNTNTNFRNNKPKWHANANINQ